MRKLALKFKRKRRFDAVGSLGFAPGERRLAMEWRMHRVAGQLNAFTGEEIRPVAGHLFRVLVGRDCEPLLLGLCHYGRGGWRLKSFCKTQYAGLHGWEHFRRCHTAVIDLLAAAKSPGLMVKITDESDYWPGRDLNALRRNLDEMNAAVAAAAGVLKDVAETGDGVPVQGPILAHSQFERIEAEGEARGYASRLRNVLK
ncbi:MAG: hypothetical protein FJ403_07580 [Verrucomicrobia bacterium]|nr:hypothetical protein [Verrucomicrobiota bacterium]